VELLEEQKEKELKMAEVLSLCAGFICGVLLKAY
jgi:hypothetical protein